LRALHKHIERTPTMRRDYKETLPAEPFWL
jgi:hypothetical protein